MSPKLSPQLYRRTLKQHDAKKEQKSRSVPGGGASGHGVRTKEVLIKAI